MSGTLRITFDADMPAATVEVVAPDLESVDRVWLAPGQQKSVEVPSEESFLRVHLASGEIVTLDDPGNLDRHITMDALKRHLQPRHVQPASVKRRLRSRGARGPAAAEHTPIFKAAAGPRDVVRLMDGPNEIAARRAEDGAMVFTPALPNIVPQMLEPYDLYVEAPNLSMRVRIPSFLEELRVRSEARAGRKRLITVRVRTSSAAADAMGSYLHRGDLHAAAAMAEWASGAKELLAAKQRNPFSATVGAYLLLRLHDFARMHDWPRNLADWFPRLADGSIIWAWQQIHQRGSEQEIRAYCMKALAAGLPVFTEGLRLLRQGLTLMGDKAASEQLDQRAGVVFWNSPFTATCRPAAGGEVPDVDIDYARRI